VWPKISPVEPRKGRSEKMEVSPTHFVLKLRPALGDQHFSVTEMSHEFPMDFPQKNMTILLFTDFTVVFYCMYRQVPHVLAIY